MNKIAIVYWSGTGNTEIMAQSLQQGVEEAGGSAQLLQPGEFSAARLDEFDAVAFGCPSMGVEELEEGEFAPMFDALEQDLSGRKLALFGSYGWGDGEWMRTWMDRCKDAGARMIQEEGLIINEEPDDNGKAQCRSLGGQLAAC